MDKISLIICGFLLVAVVSIVYYTFRYGISPMPSSRRCTDVILDNLPGNCKGTIYELGSGWGGVAISIARKLPYNQVVAYEISLIPYLISTLRKNIFFKNRNLKIIRTDFFNASLENAGCIVCYLYSIRMKQVQDKIYSECKSETIIISSVFAFPEKQPLKIIDSLDLLNSKTYIYKI